MVHFRDIWFGGNAIQTDLDAIIILSLIFNHFKVVEVQRC